MVSVVIPIFNAAPFLPRLLDMLSKQTLLHEIILIDSGSTDNTHDILRSYNLQFIQISKAEFNHGATRNLGLEQSKFEIVLFLTQDALPASSLTLELLVNMLKNNENMAMAYGRQLPYPQTKVFGRVARIMNYPDGTIVKNKDLIPKMGIKTCACSNSFAAYYKSELTAVGGFPSHTILGEDVSVAARFILLGKTIGYSADAQVYHSHDYSIVEEFKRYFDIGVFHLEQREVLSQFSQAESEGFKYVIEELKYLISNGHTILIPLQIIRTFAKYVGYILGRHQNFLPLFLKRKFSMHKSFWL